MGQSLKKLAPGSEENKAKEIGPVIEDCYRTYFARTDQVHQDWKSDDFYHAVCETIEEINKTLGSTQFRVPKTGELEQAFEKHHRGKDKAVTKEEFHRILQDVIFDTRFSGFGAKDMLMYIFGVPMTTLFVKQKIFPKTIPNEIFIPVVTSVTVFVLAKLNKI